MNSEFWSQPVRDGDGNVLQMNRAFRSPTTAKLSTSMYWVIGLLAFVVLVFVLTGGLSILGTIALVAMSYRAYVHYTNTRAWWDRQR